MSIENTLIYQIKGIFLANSSKKTEQNNIEKIFTPERSRDTAFASRLKLFWTRFIATNQPPTLSNFSQYLQRFEVENRYDSKYWWEELAPGRSSQCDACGAHISRRLITLSNDSQLIRLGDTCEHHLKQDFSLFDLDLEYKTHAKEKKRKTKMAAQLEELVQALPGYLASQPERFLNAIRSSLREEMKQEYREKLEGRLQNLDYYLQSHWISQDNLTRKLLSEMQPDVNFLNTLLANPHLSDEDKLAARKLCGSLSELTAEEANKIFQQVLCYKYINLPMTLNEIVSDIRYLHKNEKIAEENYRRISPLLDLEEVLVIEALTIAHAVPNLYQLRTKENESFLAQYSEFAHSQNFSHLLDWYHEFIIEGNTKVVKPQKEIRAALESKNRPLSDKELKILKRCYEISSNSSPSLEALLREIPIEEFQEITKTAVVISRKAAVAQNGLILKGNYLPVEDLPQALVSQLSYDTQETAERIIDRWLHSSYSEEGYQKARKESQTAISAGLFPNNKEFLARVAKAHAKIKNYSSIEEYSQQGKDISAVLSFIEEVETAGLALPYHRFSFQNSFFHPKTIAYIEQREAIYRQSLGKFSVEEINQKISFLQEREIISHPSDSFPIRKYPSVHLSLEDPSQKVFERDKAAPSDFFKKIISSQKLEEMLKRINEEFIELTPEKKKQLERTLSSKDRFLVKALYHKEICLEKEPTKEQVYFSPAAWEEIEAYNAHLDNIAGYGRSLSKLFSEGDTRIMLYCLAENLPLQVDYTESTPLSRVPTLISSEDWLIHQYQLAKYNSENKKECRFRLRPFDFSPLIESGKEFHQDGKKAKVTLVNRYSPERHHIGQRFGEVVAALPEFRTDKDSHWLITSRIDYKDINGLLWKIYQLNRKGGIDLAVELRE